MTEITEHTYTHRQLGNYCVMCPGVQDFGVLADLALNPGFLVVTGSGEL